MLRSHVEHHFIRCQFKAIESMKEDRVLFSSESGDLLKVKHKLDIKLNNVPPSKEIAPEKIRDLSSHHLGKMIVLFGTVVRTGNVNSRELLKRFECKQCGLVTVCLALNRKELALITPHKVRHSRPPVAMCSSREMVCA